jgi:hypothetical protein
LCTLEAMTTTRDGPEAMSWTQACHPPTAG